MNKTKQNKIDKKQRGFVALFLVTIIAFFAIAFIVTSSVRAWTQETNVAEIRSNSIAMLNAVSCVDIARLAIFLGHDYDGIETEYYLPDGDCVVDSITNSSGRILLLTSSIKNGIKIFVEAVLESGTLEITSLREQ